MNFGEAVEAAKRGESVTCDRWVRGDRMLRMFLVSGDGMNDPYIAWQGRDGTQEPMSFSHTNVLAEDWEILPEEGP